MNGRDVEIFPYNQCWASDFKTIVGALRSALGQRALRIDHIGSTSVPGLASKDIIDVQVTVDGFEEISLVQEALRPLGYELCIGISDHLPPGWIGAQTEWEKRFFAGPPNHRRTNLHIRAKGRANMRYALLFRDYLRARPNSAAAYAELKRLLAQNLPDLKTYADVKDPACDLIIAAAEEWAVATGWRIE